MSLSLGPDIDMKAIINGGPEFIDRLTKLQDATAKHQTALADLNLGKAAAVAHVEASRHLDSTREKCAALLDDANKQADDIKTRLASHEAAAKAATNDALNAAYMAKAEAEALKAGAADAHRKAIEVRDAATAAHQKVMAAADTKAAQTVADAQKAADALLARAKTHHDAAVADRNDAAALKAKWNDKAAKIASLAAGD